jgi:hypothetical protein
MIRSPGMTEKEILEIVSKYFEKKKYRCKIHHLIFTKEHYTEFDLICRSSEKPQRTLIVDVNPSGTIISLRDFIIKKNRVIDQLHPSSYRFYLCINASAILNDAAKSDLATNEIGLIRVNQISVELIEEPESPSKAIQEVLKRSVSDIIAKSLEISTRKNENEYSEILRHTNAKIEEVSTKFFSFV